MNKVRRSSPTVDRTRRLRATRTERALISRYVHELAGDAKRAVAVQAQPGLRLGR